jgi:hypothetical protein
VLIYNYFIAWNSISPTLTTSLTIFTAWLRRTPSRSSFVLAASAAVLATKLLSHEVLREINVTQWVDVMLAADGIYQGMPVAR